MSGLQKILSLRDSIVHVTFANDVLSVFTISQHVLSYDFILNKLSERELQVTDMKAPSWMGEGLKNKIAKGMLKHEAI